MVGDNDACRTGLQRLFRTGHGHDTLEDKGLARHGGDVLQLRHGLAACRRRQPLQKRQASGVNVHGDGVGVRRLDHIHLLPDGLHVPRLHGGYAAAAAVLQRVHSALHYGGIRPVAGKGRNSGLGTTGHQHVIVGKVIVLVAVVHGHRAHRSRHHGNGQLMAEKVITGVHLRVFADGVHVDAKLLPLLIVPDCTGAKALGAGAGNHILAGQAAAHRAGMALSHAGPGLLQNFLIRHRCFLHIFIFPDCPLSGGQ